MTGTIEIRSRLEDECDRLASENVRLRAIARGQEEEIVSLMNQVGQLREALRPFADIVPLLAHKSDSASLIVAKKELGGVKCVFASDLRTAARVLETEQPQ